MRRTSLIVAAAGLLATVACAQTPRVAGASDEQVIHALDQLVQDIDAARAEAIRVRRWIPAVRTPKERDLLLDNLHVFTEQLRKLTADFETKVAPDKVKADADPLRSKIDAALAQRDMKKAASKLKALIAAAAGSKLLALVHVCHADMLRMQAEQKLRSGSGQSQAITTLRRALASYEKSLAAPDLSDAKLGTSVHAVALRHIVQIRAAFFDYHTARARQGRRGATREAQKELAEAIKAKDLVLRLHPQARLGTGGLVIEAVKRDVRRLTGGRR